MADFSFIANPQTGNVAQMAVAGQQDKATIEKSKRQAEVADMELEELRRQRKAQAFVRKAMATQNPVEVLKTAPPEFRDYSHKALRQLEEEQFVDEERDFTREQRDFTRENNEDTLLANDLALVQGELDNVQTAMATGGKIARGISNADQYQQSLPMLRETFGDMMVVPDEYSPEVVARMERMAGMQHKMSGAVAKATQDLVEARRTGDQELIDAASEQLQWTHRQAELEQLSTMALISSRRRSNTSTARSVPTPDRSETERSDSLVVLASERLPANILSGLPPQTAASIQEAFSQFTEVVETDDGPEARLTPEGAHYSNVISSWAKQLQHNNPSMGYQEALEQAVGMSLPMFKTVTRTIEDGGFMFFDKKETRTEFAPNANISNFATMDANQLASVDPDALNDSQLQQYLDALRKANAQ